MYGPVKPYSAASAQFTATTALQAIQIKHKTDQFPF